MILYFIRVLCNNINLYELLYLIECKIECKTYFYLSINFACGIGELKDSALSSLSYYNIGISVFNAILSQERFYFPLFFFVASLSDR